MASAKASPRSEAGQVDLERDGGRERVVEVQRARVLAAMIDLAAIQGLAATTVGDVVSRAGVSRRTFYALFKDRDACFAAAFDHGVEELANFVIPAYEQERSWRDRMRVGLAALLQFLDDEPELGKLCVVSVLSGGEELLERRRRVLGVLQRAVDAGRTEAPRGKAPPPLTAEGVVGAVLAVIHARLAGDARPAPLGGLLAPLMAVIVLPYLGAAAARREATRPDRAPRRGVAVTREGHGDPLAGLNMRLTYRTLRALAAIAAHPTASNREVAEGAGIVDQGQVSKLLARLEGLGLIRNDSDGDVRGAPNAWTLTDRGRKIEGALRNPGSRQVDRAA
jgi:AcrR family transcriptional regulator/DNA-binding MarR family transcriptional regulator